MVAFLERWQVPLLIVALGLGVLIAPLGDVTPAINPVLMALLYATFLAVPLRALRAALIDVRFLTALLILNFVVVPVVVFALSRFVASDPVLLLGVLLVLLAPCIDYVIVFSGLAGAANERLLAAAPILMLVQMLLIPVYVRLLGGPTDLIEAGPFLEALVLFIVIPLGLAACTQWLKLSQIMVAMNGLMVPLMMLTLMVVVASQIGGVEASMLTVVPIYVAFVAFMVPLGKIVGRLFGQDVPATRALVFSGVTRNSLVVLPLALAVPGVAPVVVTQTLVELVAMVILVRFVPRMVPKR
ncbi:Sodium Bile acid symporter family protein [Corynebacterium atrinae]|uniref:arsenic resistance protein n=1 Tax=Corynebacterium atrinae TaxID=1336740 RepID=UPI0025B34FBC|nr:arsenic resistance protein [Corynebacterium atrinae]WJY62644.1 Sodium Bile acid symporter family protein [Corynebacterium atrinae]